MQAVRSNHWGQADELTKSGVPTMRQWPRQYPIFAYLGTRCRQPSGALRSFVPSRWCETCDRWRPPAIARSMVASPISECTGRASEKMCWWELYVRSGHSNTMDSSVQLVRLQTICGSELDDKAAFVVATMWRTCKELIPSQFVVVVLIDRFVPHDQLLAPRRCAARWRWSL
jgi:hypothetical protein